MKIIIPSFLVFFLFFISCKGPAGPIGPTGPTGAQGTTGPQGPAGQNGNANVQQINFTAKTHTGTTDLFLAFPSTITFEIAEKSLFYAYVKQTTKGTDGKDYSYWFSIPGETITGNEYSFYTFSGSTSNTGGIFLRRVVNYIPGNESFEGIRILIIPANTVTNGRVSTVNFKNYQEVRTVFQLAD